MLGRSQVLWYLQRLLSAILGVEDVRPRHLQTLRAQLVTLAL